MRASSSSTSGSVWRNNSQRSQPPNNGQTRILHPQDYDALERGFRQIAAAGERVARLDWVGHGSDAGSHTEGFHLVGAQKHSRRVLHGNPKKKGDRYSGRLLRTYARLHSLNVLSLPALGSFNHAELNGLAFLQRAEAARLNCRVVDETVHAILTADEAVALRVIEPLNCSLFHGDAYPSNWCSCNWIGM